MQMFIRKAEGISAVKKVLDGSRLNSEASKMREEIRSLEKKLSDAEASAKLAGRVQAELSEAKRELSQKTQELSRIQKLTATLDQQVSELKKSFFKTCPEFGEEFPFRQDLIRTSWFDGSFQGFRCPNEGCQGVAAPEVED
jgi:predicted nuclease with TOPRIM domain